MLLVPLSSTVTSPALALRGGVLVPAAGATAYVFEHGTEVRVPVYENEEGGTELAQPLVAGATGGLPGFIAAGQRISVELTYNGNTTTENIEVLAGNESVLETARAEAAEDLLAPKASPALTGTPTAPTAAALTDTTQIATTAYADSAVAVEKARAMTAEAAAVTTAESAAAGYVAVETARAEGAETTIANNVTAETTRAEAAEALKAPLASPGLTGNPTAPTQAAKDNSTKLATTAFVDVAVGEEATARATAVTAAITTAETASDAAGTAAADVLVEKTRALAAEALLVPLAEIGANSGVMGLTAGGIGAQPPAHHASTHAEGGTDPLTVADLPVSLVTSSAAGFAPSVIFLDTTPEFYGAKGDGVTDDTAAFQACSEAVKADGGGIVRLSAKTYVVDGLIWESGTIYEGRGTGGTGTILKAKAGSANPGQIMLAKGEVRNCGFKNIRLQAAGNAEQDAFYLFPEGTGAGFFNATFKNLRVGTKANPYQRNCFWMRGTNSTALHQFITYENVEAVRANTGAQAESSRCLKATGVVEKLEWDAASSWDGAEPSAHVGTNMEFGREFLLATSLSAEAAAAATVIKVASVAALSNGKQFRLGDGAASEVCTVESISGTEVTLKSKLGLTHASGANVYALSGTVEAPVTQGPKFIKGEQGAIQNAYLGIEIDLASVVTLEKVDFENMAVPYIARNASYKINADMRPLTAASDGVSNGTGTLTVGSAIVKAVSGEWAVGNLIAGPGIPFGSTVAAVSPESGLAAGEIKVSAVVEANGTAGEQAAIPLQKSGRGEGAIAIYEGEAQGEVSYYPQGAVDRGVVVKGKASVRIRDVARGAALPTRSSSGVALALASSAEPLKIYSARQIVLLDAEHTTRSLLGVHGTGDLVTITATVANTKFEQGATGNLEIPQTTLTLEAGGSATFMASDHGLRWVLVGVMQPQEELQWKEVEEVNAKLEEAAGYPLHFQYAVRAGICYLRGLMTVKAAEAIKTSEKVFKIPAAGAPATKRLFPAPSTTASTTLTVASNGAVECQAELVAAKKIGVDGIWFPLKP